MIYKSTELSRNTVLNLFKNYASDEFNFEVCDDKIPQYKENYFRIYVDRNPTEFFEMYFLDGKLCSFGYSVNLYSRRMQTIEHGNYKVVTKLPPAVKKFMNHMITSLNDEDYPYVVSDNAKRFLKFISKLA
jgi:hypothetical protein